MLTGSSLHRKKVAELVELAKAMNLPERKIYRYEGGPLPKQVLIINILEDQAVRYQIEADLAKGRMYAEVDAGRDAT